MEQVKYSPEAKRHEIDELMRQVDMTAIAIRHGAFNRDKPSLDSDEYKDNIDVIGHLTTEEVERTTQVGKELAETILSDGKPTIFYFVGSPTNWVNERDGFEYPNASRTIDTATAIAAGVEDFIEESGLQDTAEIHLWNDAKSVRPEKRIRDAGYDAVLESSPMKAVVSVSKALTQDYIDSHGLEVDPRSYPKDMWVEGHPVLDGAIVGARQTTDSRKDPRTSRETSSDVGSALSLAERSMRIRLANATEEERQKILDTRHVIIGGTHGLVMRASAVYGGEDTRYTRKGFGGNALLEFKFDQDAAPASENQFEHWTKVSD